MWLWVKWTLSLCTRLSVELTFRHCSNYFLSDCVDVTSATLFPKLLFNNRPLPFHSWTIVFLIAHPAPNHNLLIFFFYHIVPILLIPHPDIMPLCCLQGPKCLRLWDLLCFLTGNLSNVWQMPHHLSLFSHFSLSLFLSLGVCLCVCVLVCLRERELPTAVSTYLH